MSISRDDALRIFDETYREPDLEIHEVGETGSDHRTYPILPDTWFIRFSFGSRTLMLIGPSRLVCIAKSDGRIVYDGSASDEG